MNATQKLAKRLPPQLRRPLGDLRRRLRTLPSRTRRQQQRLLEDPALDADERELVRQIESRISPGDGMYIGDGGHYFKVGLAAIHLIEEAINTSGRPAPMRILDLPCAHGRVLRFLAQRFPNAKFTACDLDRKGVDFCARMFGVEPVYSQLDLSRLSLDSQFDLIWCGSLVTHLNAEGIRDLLEFFARHLSREGLLMFTTHGERVVQRMLDQEFEYGIARESIPSLIESYQRNGIGFVDYPGESAYGVSLTAPAWIRSEAVKLGLDGIYFREHGWDDHQDVYGFVHSFEPDASRD